MQKLIILGASNALPTQESENTHLVIVGNERMVLVDTPGSVTVLRFEQAGLNLNDLTDLIATHFHPDHTLGIPAVLMDMWIMGRTRPLTIHGLGYTLERVKALLDLYGWSEWPGFFPVDFHPLPAQELTLALDCSDFSIHTSPVCHGIPNIGLRITLKGSGRVIGYSCDTAPCEQTVRLGSGADVLIHEAGGDFAGHSSAQQAGEIARQAEVGRLILIHYPSGRFAAADLIEQARSSFTGDVTLAKDMMTLT